MRVAFSILVIAAVAAAEVVEITASQDAYICDCKPDSTNPNGGPTHLYFGRYSSCLDRTLVEWDLSAIPQDAVVESAEMRLYCISFFGSASGQPVFQLIGEDWDEQTVTLNTQPSIDPEPSVGGSWPVAQSWFSVDVTQFVEAWVSGAHPNHGIYCTSTGTTGNCAPGFWSKDSGHEDLLPTLVVTYSPYSLEGGSWAEIKAAQN